MSTRAGLHTATVVAREQVSPHLVRLRLSGAGMGGFTSSGVPDEWVSLVVPGQFQARYYTVRSWDGAELVLDVVVHDEGLVTEWVARDCTGEEVVVSDARGSYDPPPDAGWVVLVGDLTALPAMARVCETTDLPVRVWAEVPDDPRLLADYLPTSGAGGAEVTWVPSPGDGTSGLAAVVEELVWPDGPGYFWMAGESSQMRAIRKQVMREKRLASHEYAVMGYWRAHARRQPRSVDPGPIWRAGKAAGKTDEQIWADYDAAQQRQQQDEANDG
ncbi:hypothetical protein ENKNEFLB_01995 [Nocardioides aquaticus]|uniref:FAD-binding FR-type domain-containing protein n=1 Tax=Nocardioides aquaticus TaxID=160826 RepID=A0ABX8EHN9_9ACTN|nr:siderophore-interacting protein [Nocardioides aquaticus]QVT79612.1 hypothetical protein ENKNEFLB_01995 [Nocardioides aquaticus]